MEPTRHQPTLEGFNLLIWKVLKMFNIYIHHHIWYYIIPS